MRLDFWKNILTQHPFVPKQKQTQIQAPAQQRIDAFESIGVMPQKVEKEEPPMPKPAEELQAAPKTKKKKKGFFKRLWGGIKKAAKAVGNAFKSVGKAIGNAAKNLGKSFVKAFKNVGEAFGELLKGFRDFSLKGILQGLGKVVGSLASGVVKLSGDLVRGVVQIGASLVKGVGSVLSGALQMVGDALGGFVKKATDAVGKYLVENVFNNLANMAKKVADAALGAVENVARGLNTLGEGALQVLSGEFAKGFANMAKGLGQATLQTVADTLVIAGLALVNGVQTLLGVQSPGRSLSADEIAMLREVYGDSIDYSQVVIQEGRLGLMGFGDRPFVVGNTIYVPSGGTSYAPDGKMRHDILVHEMAHVWQYQNAGPHYISEAIAAQWWGPENPKSGSRGYYYDGAVTAGIPFEQLNPEQQGQLIQDAFNAGVVPPDMNKNRLHQSEHKMTSEEPKFYINGEDYTAYVLRAWEMMKAGEGAPK